MKKVKHADELRPEYKLSDFKTPLVRGKYYARIMKEGIEVPVLDPGVAKIVKKARQRKRPPE